MDYDDSYSLDDKDSSDNVQAKAPTPKTFSAPAAPAAPKDEDPVDLDINPSEEPAFEDPFAKVEP